MIKLTIGSNITNTRKWIDMERKEEIIQATLMLASKNGIDNVSMSQIATQLGIKEPSLYNHFRSKDEIAKAMYDYLRTQAKEKLKITDLDYGKLVKDKSLEEVLKLAVHNYCKMSTQSEMFSFYNTCYKLYGCPNYVRGNRKNAFRNKKSFLCITSSSKNICKRH